MSTCPVPSTAVSGLLEHYVKKILAAPDIDIDLFRAQMASVGKMRHPITVLVASDDPALKISSRLAARRMRLGLADVHDPAIQRLAVDSGIRIIDITEGETRDPAHSRYVGLISGEAGTAADVTLFGEIRQAGAFVFNQVGGALNSIGGALAE